ncbi:MAG: hypothetical protein Q9164_001260 [Protoblastenia rupestris]
MRVYPSAWRRWLNHDDDDAAGEKEARLPETPNLQMNDGDALQKQNTANAAVGSRVERNFGKDSDDSSIPESHTVCSQIRHVIDAEEQKLADK